MNLHTVTVTGVDPSISLTDLLALSREFPFVEWGVLLSQSAGVHPKYPDHEWVESLCHFARENGMALSGHMCGAWSKRLLVGEWPQVMNRFTFKRLQLNIGKVSFDSSHSTHWISLLPRACEVIIQFNYRIARFDSVALCHALELSGISASVLMDASAGRGVSPADWPVPPPVGKVGYAGGLSPQNIGEQLVQIGATTIGYAQTIWVDMETGVRFSDGLHMDLDRVRYCLSQAAAFVLPQARSRDI